jgi:hypothetical protein
MRRGWCLPANEVSTAFTSTPFPGRRERIHWSWPACVRSYIRVRGRVLAVVVAWLWTVRKTVSSMVSTGFATGFATLEATRLATGCQQAVSHQANNKIDSRNHIGSMPIKSHQKTHLVLYFNL